MTKVQKVEAWKEVGTMNVTQFEVFINSSVTCSGRLTLIVSLRLGIHHFNDHEF